MGLFFAKSCPNLQPTAEAVDQMHAEFHSQNYSAPTPAKLQRGGTPAYGFYFQAPGGVLVEVSTLNLDLA